MKNHFIPVLILLVLISSCKSNISKEQHLNQISEIENGLLPSVIIDGEETETYNINDRMKYHHVPGMSIAFMDQGEIIWAKGYGYTSLDSMVAVDINTLFQAASISKPVAAMAALHLVEEEKLGLDDNVNDYLVGWQVEENKFTTEEKVTLRRLLSHSAGLTVHGFGGYSDTDSVPGIIQVLKGEAPANSGRIFPDTIPGSIYRYSGGGYTVMQKMLCDITGKEFPVIMDEYVLSVIGMESSTYKQQLPSELESKAAIAYRADGSMVKGRWHIYPEMAAAGLWTNPTDLLKYATEVHYSLLGKSNKVLSKDMTREMLSPQMNSHGLGPGVGGKNLSATFGHGGANEGYRCQLYVFSHTGQGVAIMTNSDKGDVLMGEVLRSFSSVYNWDNYKPEIKKIIDLDEASLNKVAGEYYLEIPDNIMWVNFSVEGSHLKGIHSLEESSFEIYPESNKLFFNNEDRSSFEFIINSEGDVTEVIIQNQWHFLKKIENN